jgi:alkanesulfonate monooxygenase
MTNGRLLINIVTGGDALEQQRFGDWLSHDERYARTDEFLRSSGCVERRAFDFEGWHYKIRGATSLAPPDPVRVYSSAARPPSPRRSPPAMSTSTCCGLNHQPWPESVWTE